MYLHLAHHLGRLTINNKAVIKKRLLETSLFTQDVSDYGVFPDSEGFKSCVRVRLLHAWVRKFCYKRENSFGF
jgi:hypothetical protein